MIDALSQRRRFLIAAGAGAVLAVGGRLGGETAHAADKPRLDPASERARELGYTHEAASTDSDAREEDARCANCAHFKGEAGDQWASCNIFPQHLVNADGWCTSWYSAG